MFSFFRALNANLQRIQRNTNTSVLLKLLERSDTSHLFQFITFTSYGPSRELQQAVFVLKLLPPDLPTVLLKTPFQQMQLRHESQLSRLVSKPQQCCNKCSWRQFEWQLLIMSKCSMAGRRRGGRELLSCQR